MPIAIGFRDLYIPLTAGDEGQSNRAPLSSLDEDEHSHVHGTLWIRVNGQELPALGYFGLDDACLGSWAAELAAVVSTLESKDPASYIFDEGEQGQPAFVFDREGPSIRISLKASKYDDAAEPPTWAPQTCDFADFGSEVKGFLASLDSAVHAASPAGINWVQAQLREAG